MLESHAIAHNLHYATNNFVIALFIGFVFQSTSQQASLASKQQLHLWRVPKNRRIVIEFASCKL